MKKVININFQGRVIPIEESAYEELKKYTDSLHRYFAREEGKEEIINDIENRIAELFIERLKNNPEYWTLKVQYDHLEKQERFMKVELEILEKKFRVLEQIVTLVRIECCLVNSFDGEVIHLEGRI